MAARPNPSTVAIAGTWQATEFTTWTNDAYAGGNLTCQARFEITIPDGPATGAGVIATVMGAHSAARTTRGR